MEINIDEVSKELEKFGLNLKPLLEQLKKKESDLNERFAPSLMKKISINNCEAHVTLTKKGSVIINFSDSNEAEKFYNALK